MTKERIVGWTKLNHECFKCHKPYSDIEFTFATRLGQRSESYHWKCCPAHLKGWQEDEERSMMLAAQTPPGR